MDRRKLERALAEIRGFARRARFEPSVKRFGLRSLDAVMPPRCPLTGEPVTSPSLLSANGWSTLRFVGEPFCPKCALPFDVDHGADAVCGFCLTNPTGLDQTRAAVVYNDAAHDLIVGFKHSDKAERAGLFAPWLARVGAGLFSRDALLVPVPLHRRRMVSRKYNQSALLCQALTQTTDVETCLDGLIRARPTRAQQGLDAEARSANVKGAFVVNDKRRGELSDRAIILVDDVFTTGATLAACARALRKCDVRTVSALVIARVVREGGDAI
ncbi:MAG: ComF family protein [Pseudomonadota bacterium]